MSVFDKLNRTGRCTQCAEPIYDIKTQYDVGHPYEGEARTVEAPLPSCRIVTMILMNGHQCKITMCESCLSLPYSLADIWRKVVRTNIFQSTDEYRQIHNSPVLTKEQKEIQNKQHEKLVFNVPVGIITIRKAGD